MGGDEPAALCADVITAADKISACVFALFFYTGGMQLSSSTVLITGAARRLGRAAAEAFAAEGAQVVLHYHSSAEEAGELAKTLRSQGSRCMTIGADLSSAEEAEQLLPRVREAGFHPDLLVNSSSLWRRNSLADVEWDDLQSSLRLSAFAPLALSRSFANELQGGGAIINVLDARIADYDRRHLSYHLSKRLLADLTRIMAVEYAPAVRVNGIAPGIILPPEGAGEELLERIRRATLLRRLGTVDEYRQALIFLASNAFLTGQLLYLDGGRSLRGRMYG